ncbi:MAG: extracellular solute-binding protein, partial [Alphaproteobacteria bacterium]|nr:extracellular solute-binding protein [Alphaproteobacteria bacterium]
MPATAQDAGAGKAASASGKPGTVEPVKAAPAPAPANDALSAIPAEDASHGLSIFGDLKYPQNFKHFDYVNPNAPKGGRMATIGGESFDSFNPFILKGDSAAGLGLLFDTLMQSSDDEVDAAYGLVAHSVKRSRDGREATFFMRPEAKFSDGSPVTAADVAFSFDTLKEKGHPAYRFQLRDVEKAEAIDQHTVRYAFTGNRLRDLPLVVAGLPILSKAYYDKVDFTKTTLTPPVGSGPYKLTDFQPNSFVRYERRDDYWGKDLPVNRGRNNFDELVFRYYRDRSAGFLGLSAGEYDMREEFTSKRWATGYNFPAVKDGRVKLLTLNDDNPSGTQGWFLNTRREKFQDPRVRRAIGYAFDFEWSNKNLFFNLYKRTESYFENSDMKATGKPSPEELALLEPFRDKLPPDVFGPVETPPVSDGSGRDRNLLRKADQLLREAGWTLDGRKRVNAKGEQLTIEMIRVDTAFDRIIAPFITNLQLLGIDANIRAVDAAQYERRLKSFDFDVAIARFVMSKTPGIELRNYFSSDVADVNGSRNLAGIRNPVVDALIDK